MSQTPPARPEDRRRSTHEGLAALETLSACMRSEAFAEDLPPAPDTRVAAPRRLPRTRAVLARRLAWGDMRGLLGA